MSMYHLFNDIFVEYSKLQFPNSVIICNRCFCVVSVIVVTLNLINAYYHLVPKLLMGGLVPYFQTLCSDTGTSPNRTFLSPKWLQGIMTNIGKALLKTFSNLFLKPPQLVFRMWILFRIIRPILQLFLSTWYLSLN